MSRKFRLFAIVSTDVTVAKLTDESPENCREAAGRALHDWLGAHEGELNTALAQHGMGSTTVIAWIDTMALTPAWDTHTILATPLSRVDPRAMDFHVAWVNKAAAEARSAAAADASLGTRTSAAPEEPEASEEYVPKVIYREHDGP